MKHTRLVLLRLAIVACLFTLATALLLFPAFTGGQASRIAPARAADSPILIKSHVITPAQMSFTGDVAVCGGVIPDPTVAAWCTGVPTGTIMLGVDPASANPANWNGGQATASIYIAGVSSPTVAVLSVAWPDRDGKGIHSPLRGKVGSIAWDGVPVWVKSTRDVGSFGDYYAIQHRPVLASMVITQSITHTLRFQVPVSTAWDISKITLDFYPMWNELRGIAYSPFRDCQNPDWGPFPTEAEIEADLARLAHMSNGIRTYSALGIIGDIPAMAQRYGLPVAAGAWLGREKDENGNPVPNRNRDEIEALVTIANSVPVDFVIVGNEVLLRGDLSEDELIAYIEEVKSRVHVPVTTAEISSLFRAHPKLVSAVDLVLIHIYPYWDGQSIDGSVDYVTQEYLNWRSSSGGKRIVIGETGWPSGGSSRGDAAPSLENQKAFYHAFLMAAEQHSIEFYYFDAFDELWKREGGVGSHWGYADHNRIGKHDVQSVLIPYRYLFPNEIYLPRVFQYSASALADPRSSPLVVIESDPAMQAEANVANPFFVFDDYAGEANHFAPSGWMGDIGDMRFYECERDNRFSGQVAIRAGYDPQGPQGWAGIYWQEPDGNWGTQPEAGYNLDNASALRFAAKGATGGEQVTFLMGGITGPHPDSQQPALSTDIITLTSQWTTYTIDLRGRNLSQVIGGFGFVTDKCLNTKPITFYLDSIYYVTGGDPGAPAPTPTPSAPYTFPVYRDKDVAGDHYAPSGAMGDIGDVSLDECWRGDAHSGGTAIRVEYRAQGQGPSECGGASPCNWAGVYWQAPAHNWGDRPGGYDLTGARGITFWAKGAAGGELITFKVGGIACGTSAPYPDSLCPAVPLDPAPIYLTNTWQLYTITLGNSLPLTRVVGGFLWAASKPDNPHGATFYLDDIQYLFNTNVPLQPHWIYYGPRLAEGYDMGITTSHGVTGWVTDMGSYMRMAYPPGQAWGAVFITVGPPKPPPRPGKNLSAYKSLVVELRGQNGGEDIWIGLKDNEDADDGTETKIPLLDLTPTWQTFTIPLSSFATAEKSRLYVVTEFVFEPGTPAETVYFRKIRFVP